jgi:hypothetical protein
VHDPTKWHGLVEYNSNGSIRCTYRHTHMDDPRVLDSVFGKLPYGEISYPWQTHSMAGDENVAHHTFYNWGVVQGQNCYTAGGGKSFTDIRLEAHNDGNAGATTRFHSYFLQARGCDMNDPSFSGTISMGGHLDFGLLLVRTLNGDVNVPLPADTSPVPVEPGTNRSRLHGSPGSPLPKSVWYGGSGAVKQGNIANIGLTIGVGKEDWGPVDPSNPTKLLFYGGDQNGSLLQPAHLVDLYIPEWLDGMAGVDTDGAKNEYLTFQGFTDRYANIVPSCSPVGPDCVPLSIQHMKVGHYQYRADEHGVGEQEYDVKVNGQSLIQFPN